ncbi:zinc-ribbon domain-containing protein [Candidatus Woesearchaeota archaeon]|jgi:uncharacterized membrane protein YvbJ|nr:zinc-ribbon domain-containing protein [Candidatus Woesearchaeota archaeon]MBT5528495.1 zinc-ribbon domain-containing protein [Cytophagia bacterium]MBT5991928.1 zinc-ribbon domain-containing protein [Bacteroidota bacterium]
MSLIPCPDCGKQISDQASTCIECGRPLESKPPNKDTSDSSEPVKKGRQRSKLRNDLGNAFALVGIIVSIIAGIYFGSFPVGIVSAFATVGVGIWIAYGS